VNVNFRVTVEVGRDVRVSVSVTVREVLLDGEIDALCVPVGLFSRVVENVGTLDNEGVGGGVIVVVVV